MSCRHSALLACLSLGLFLYGTATCNATGRWDLPSSVPQYFGHGHGPGYHAPMIRARGYYPPKPPRYHIVETCGENPFCQYPQCPCIEQPCVDRNSPPCPSCQSTTQINPLLLPEVVSTPIPALFQQQPTTTAWLPRHAPRRPATTAPPTSGSALFSPPQRQLGLVKQIPFPEPTPASHDHREQQPLWR